MTCIHFVVGKDSFFLSLFDNLAGFFIHLGKVIRIDRLY